MSTHHKAVLESPRAREIYPSLRRAAWLTPFFDSDSPGLRRLGAQLLIDELLAKLAPSRGASVEAEERRTKRIEGQKRAVAMFAEGFTFAHIGRELGVCEQRAARWARRGRST